MIFYSRGGLTTDGLDVAKAIHDFLSEGEGASVRGFTVLHAKPGVFKVEKDIIDAPPCRFSIQKGR